MSNILLSDLLDLLQSVHAYCEHAHRTRPNMLDVVLAMDELGIETSDLREHLENWRDQGAYSLSTRVICWYMWDLSLRRPFISARPPKPSQEPRRPPPLDFRPPPNPVIADQIPPRPKYAYAHHPPLPYRYTFDREPAPPPKPPSEVELRAAELKRIRNVRAHLLEIMATRREMFPEVVSGVSNFETALDIRDLAQRGLLKQPLDVPLPEPVPLPNGYQKPTILEPAAWNGMAAAENGNGREAEMVASGPALNGHFAREEPLRLEQQHQGLASDGLVGGGEQTQPAAHGEGAGAEEPRQTQVPGPVVPAMAALLETEDLDAFAEPPPPPPQQQEPAPIAQPVPQALAPVRMPRTLADDDDDDEDEEFMIVD